MRSTTMGRLRSERFCFSFGIYFAGGGGCTPREIHSACLEWSRLWSLSSCLVTICHSNPRCPCSRFASVESAPWSGRPSWLQIQSQRGRRDCESTGITRPSPAGREAPMRARPATKWGQALIDELRSAFDLAPQVSADGESEAANRWAQFQKGLRSLVLSRDPREFLSWDVISKTMFLAFSPYAVRELIHLKRQNNWNSRWKEALQESPVGRPAPFLLYPQTSANLIHDAYNLHAFQEATGLFPEQFHNILEFGGGYGSMCRLLFNLGFDGRYVIYDLQPFSDLQSYYLKSVGIPVLRKNSFTRSEKGVALVSDEEDLLRSAEPFTKQESLFIAAWSISETSLDVRRRFLPYAAECDAFLIAFQEQFGEMNNCQFFDRWQEETSD